MTLLSDFQKSENTKLQVTVTKPSYFPAQTEDPIPAKKIKYHLWQKNDILGTIAMKFMIVDFIDALLEILNLLLMNILLTIPQMVRKCLKLIYL